MKYFIWIRGPRGPEAQITDDLWHGSTKVIQTFTLEPFDVNLTVDQLKEKYPLTVEWDT